MRGFSRQFIFGMLLLLASVSGAERVVSAQGTDSKPSTNEARQPARVSDLSADSDTRDPWNRIETISRILSIAAIPIVLALGSWIVQRQLQKQSVGKDYVQLAVSILREPDSAKVSIDLRSWAVDLLNAYSAVKLSDAISKGLKAGQAVLPPLEGFAANPSAALTPELANQMQAALITFQQYLKESGFRIREAGTIRYEVVPGNTIKTDEGEYYAFYDSDTLTMKVAAMYAGEVDVIRHEYMRHVLSDADHGINGRIEDGSGWLNSFAVSSGLATYFPCSVKGSPVFAADHSELRVELKNDRKFRGRVRNFVRADDIGNRVWGGAFWDLREGFDEPKSADRLLASAWTAWQPKDPDADLFVEFANKLIETDQRQHSGQHVDHIQEILRGRGLNI
ncbi:MAG: hypothetical protein QOH42_1266 [Blastocatellia bacterium]|nr:hypothetical protein [Blastocatellia bacterium]